MTGVSFGDFDMQTDGCRVTATDVDSAPTNDIQADELAEADGAVIVKQRYRSKTFSVDGWLQADTVADFKALRDTFKLAMSMKNQAFDLDEDGDIRRYLANAQNIMLARTSPTSCNFSVTFLSPDGMGWDLETSELLATTAITTANDSHNILVEGTYQAEPLISATISALSGGTNKTVSISNGGDLRGISITRTWTAGDTILIDSQQRTVLVNNVAVEFSGLFPRWTAGETGTITWTDDLTTRTASLSASYTRRYL